jgi:imidazolonepropionase-like amidohydrolase
MSHAVRIATWVLLAGSGLAAQGDLFAVVGARLLTADGPPIEEGVILVRQGRIESVGARGAVLVPGAAQVVDARGRVVMPGLVDTHSHIGGIGGADASGPIQPEVRILDSLNPQDPGWRRALAGGITTVNVMPGSGHLCSGQTVYLKLRGRGGIEDWAYREEDGRVAGGLKMANGTNPLKEAPFPGTRGKSAALVRERFVAAKDYRDRLLRAGEDAGKKPARDLGLEVLVEVLEGRRVVHHHTHRADDILTVLRLREEFGFRVVLHHVSEGWKVAQEIAAAGVPCSIIVVDSPGGKIEARDLLFRTGAVLERAGVRMAYHTDDWITDSRLFRRSAALGMRAGLSAEGALLSLTLRGAEMLDLAHRVGSLTAGKDADFVVLDGDPFSLRTKVLQTWVEGRLVFDLERPLDRLIAEGGYGATAESEPYLCCCEEGR